MPGNMTGLLATTILAAVPAPGGYCSPVKIVVMLLAVLPWLLVTPWVQKEAKRLRLPELVWTCAALGTGALSLLLWLLIPAYLLGLPIYAVLTGAVLVAFVVYRDGRVQAGQKVFSKKHLASLVAPRRPKKIAVAQKVKVYSSDNKIVLPPNPESADDAERQAYNLVQDLLHDLLWRRASEADLSPIGQQTRVRYVIDGVASDQSPLPLHDSEAVIQYLKAISGADPEELRRPQNGKIAVDLAGHPVDISLATAGTTGGQRMQFRIIQESIRTRLGELGMAGDVLEHIRANNQTGSGLVIVSGRPGMGVTSTLYSLLRDHDAFIKQLVSLEARVEVELENVTQQAYKEPAALPGMLTSALRRDPDVVMIDQCHDAETAEIVAQAAAEKSILLGMSAGDSFVALAKWVKLRGDAAEALRPLRAILCQVLLRKLCPACREAYRPDPQMLSKANLPSAKIENFHRPPSKPLTDEKGRPYTCPTCQGSGYLGRTAAFELLEVTDELRQMVAAGASLTDIKKACRKNKMLYLQEQALRKVIEGETSIQEVLRVSQPPKK